MPKLVPVDFDPFAQPATPRQPRLVPVDFDPFADTQPTLAAQSEAFDEEHGTFENIGNSLKRGWYGMKSGVAGLMESDAIERGSGADEFGDVVLGTDPGGNPIYASETSLGRPSRAVDVAKDVAAGSAARLAESHVENANAIAALPSRPATAALTGAETFGEGWDALKQDPLGVIGDLGVESSVQMLPALLATVLSRNPAVAAAAAGANSGAVEFGSGIVDYLGQSGVDTTNKEAVATALKDPKTVSDAMRYARTRAGIVGSFDAASGGLASKVLVPGKGLVREGVNTLIAQPAAQAAMGAGGEATAQLVTTGKVDAGAVLAEAVGEGFTAPVEAASFALERRKSVIDKVFGGKGVNAGDVLGNTDPAPGLQPMLPDEPVDNVAPIPRAPVTLDESGNPIAAEPITGMPAPIGPAAVPSPPDFMVDPEGTASAQGDWRAREQARRARSGGPGMGPTVDGAPTMAEPDMAQAAFDSAIESIQATIGRKPTKASLKATAESVAARFGVNPAALIERNANPIRTPTPEPVAAAPEPEPAPLALPSPADIYVDPQGGATVGRAPQIARGRAIGDFGPGMYEPSTPIVEPNVPQIEELPPVDAAVESAVGMPPVSPITPVVTPKVQGEHPNAPQIAPVIEPVPTGKMWRAGKKRLAAQTPDGTWFTRIKQGGRWQPWQKRRNFDPSGAFGYTPFTPPTGNVRINGAIYPVGERTAEATSERAPPDVIDSIIAAGGLNREEMQRFGIDPKLFGTRRGATAWLFPRTGGMTLSALRQRLQDDGYFPAEDPDAPPTISDDDAFEIVQRALNQGDRIVSMNNAGAEAAYQNARQAVETSAIDAFDAEAANQFLSQIEADLIAKRVFDQIDADAEAEAMTVMELLERAEAAGATPQELRQAYDVLGISGQVTSEQDASRNLWELIRTKEQGNGIDARARQASRGNGDPAPARGASPAGNDAQRQPADGNQGTVAGRDQPGSGEAAREQAAELERLRARVAELESARSANEVTGLPGKAAFEADESLGWSTVAAIDMDGLGRLNDATSHEAANVVMVAMANAMRAAQVDGVRFYHLHGDELAARFQNPDDAARITLALQDALAAMTVRINLTLENGSVRAYSYDGIGITFGLGASYATADAAAIRSKQEREAAGLRQNKNQPGAPRQLRDLSGNTERRNDDNPGGRRAGSAGQAESSGLTLTDDTVVTPPVAERPASQSGLFAPVTDIDRQRLRFERERPAGPSGQQQVDLEEAIKQTPPSGGVSVLGDENTNPAALAAPTKESRNGISQETAQSEERTETAQSEERAQPVTPAQRQQAEAGAIAGEAAAPRSRARRTRAPVSTARAEPGGEGSRVANAADAADDAADSIAGQADPGADADQAGPDAAPAAGETGDGAVAGGAPEADGSIGEVDDTPDAPLVIRYGKRKVAAANKPATKDDHGTLLKRQSPTGVARLSLVELRAVVNRVSANWKGGPRLVPLDSFAQLPAAIQQEAERQGAKPDEVKAVFSAHDGAVYLVRENLTDAADAEASILHEVIGHYGVRKLFGFRLGAALNGLLNAIGGIDGIRRIATENGISLADYESGLKSAQFDRTRDRILVEELLAHLSESSNKGIMAKVKELVGALRAWLRRHGFATLAKYGDTDLRYILGRARQAVETGVVEQVDDLSDTDIRFRRADAEDATVVEPSPAESKYAAENARIREQDVTAWTKAKKWLRKQLTPAGLLPQKVFEQKIKRDSAIDVIEFDTKHLIGELESAIAADYGVTAKRLDEKTQQLLSDMMAGKTADIPAKTKNALLGMRQYIDGLSLRYIRALEKQAKDLAEVAERDGSEQAIRDAEERIRLMEVITSNVGTYVHRSYRAFDDPSWAKKVPDKVLNDAREYLRARMIEESEQNPDRRVEVVINEILKTGTAYENVESFVRESKLGAKDLSVLKKRQQIAPEIRALLGEYTDPRINFAKSATKMGRLVWNQAFLERVRALGMGEFLFTDETKPPEATTKIAADGSEVYAPLNGLWTTPEINQAFQDSLGKEQMADWYRRWVQFNGLVKYGKTVLSPTTAMRNFMSSGLIAAASGHLNPSPLLTRRSEMEKLQYVRKMKALGVTYDTVMAGEMLRLIDDAKSVGWLADPDNMKGLKSLFEGATNFYRFGDDFWKMLGFENEKRALMDTGMTESEAEAEAAERIRNTYPTYSMIGKGIQELRRFPLVGTFVSFPAEIIRTSYNLARYLQQDYNHPKRRKLAVRRAFGMMVAGGLMFALSAISRGWMGIDDDEEEAVRLMAAPWSRNATLIFTGRDENGNLQYLDASSLDAYSYLKRPITAILRGQPIGDTIKDVGSEMLLPFLGLDMTFATAKEVIANKTDSGGPVFTEHDNIGSQTVDIADYIRKKLQPGIASNIERFYKAINGEVSKSGKKYTVEDETAALFGFRISTLDPKTALYYRSFEFKDAKSQAEKKLRDVIRDPGDVSDGDLRDAYDTTMQLRERAYRDMARLVKAAEKSGMDEENILRALIGSGMSRSDAAFIANGEIAPWVLSNQTVRDSAEKASATFGEDASERVIERYQKVSGFSDQK